MKPNTPEDTGNSRDYPENIDFGELARAIRQWSRELGFRACGITNTDLAEHETHLLNWLDADFHGDMDYMQRHGTKRSRPAELQPGTTRVISVRMDYFPDHATDAEDVLAKPQLGYVSRYALGRDYHKLMRKRLQKLTDKISDQTGEFGYRVFVDSAPVLEKALAQKAGLGWIGKSSNLLHKDSGSWFFIGEIYTDLPLPVAPDASEDNSNHCGSCTACMEACPTGAIVAPYKVDARLCISYLTIEMRGSIPEILRPAMGNRIYGCDDCQLVCPFNKFSNATTEADFQPRHELDSSKLETLFSWDEKTFLAKTEGSAIRRIGYEAWLRNIAVALGNAPTSASVVETLSQRVEHDSAIVREHVEWALLQHSRIR